MFHRSDDHIVEQRIGFVHSSGSSKLNWQVARISNPCEPSRLVDARIGNPCYRSRHFSLARAG
jgi:hypothetical protein